MSKNNYMEIETEETLKKRKKREKIDSFFNKINEIKKRRAERKAEREAKKDEKAAQTELKRKEQQAKEEEKKATKIIEETSETLTQNEESFFTQEPVESKKEKQPEVKLPKEKKVYSPAETKRKRKRKKKIIKILKLIIGLIILAVVIFLLKLQYDKYSKNVHQVLIYRNDIYEYTIKRDNNDLNVSVMRNENCHDNKCDSILQDEYEIDFLKEQKSILRYFFDFKFLFQNKTKNVTINDIKTGFGKSCLYALIHNDQQFIQISNYNKYKSIESEQMSSYTKRGYVYEKDKRILTIAMGEMTTTGYAITIVKAHKDSNGVVFYIREDKPTTGENLLTVITHPMLQIELEEKVDNVYVYVLDSGEKIYGYDEERTTKIVRQQTTNSTDNDELIDILGSKITGILK